MEHVKYSNPEDYSPREVLWVTVLFGAVMFAAVILSGTVWAT